MRNIQYHRLIVMLIGSSMTQRAFDPTYQGFGIGLTDWYTRIADVILRGLSGYNSRWLLAGFRAIIGGYFPDLVVLFIGNNDATKGFGQFVPLDEFQSNVVTMIEILREINPKVVIILVTPSRANVTIRSDDETKLYAQSLRDIVIRDNSKDIALLDLWEGDFAIEVGDLHDGSHLNAAGNKKVLEGILDTIRVRFPQFVPFHDALDSGATSTLTYKFPLWIELAGKSIDESREVIKSSINRP